eukprot:3488849-Amphidinium_carterae.3
MVAMQASNTDFKKEIDKCRKVLEGQREKPANQTFDDEDKLELRMTRNYIFVPDDEKEKAFGAGAVIPSDIPKLELKDECGQPITGFLFRSADPFRVVEASWSTSTKLSTSIMSSSSQIRQNQGRDIAEWWRADVLEHRPGPLAAKPKAVLLTIAEAQQKIREAIAKEEQERKEREAAAAAAAESKLSGGGDAAMPAADAADQAEQTTENAEEEEEEEDEPDGLTLPSQRVGGKRKGSKGRGKSKGSTKGKRAKTTQSKTHSTSGHAAGEVTGPKLGARDLEGAQGLPQAPPPSTARSVSAKSMQPDRLQQAKRHIFELKLSDSDTLLCHKNGNDINNAKRCFECMKKEGGFEFTPEYIELDNHIQLEKEARKVSVKALWVTPRDEFMDIVSRMWPRLDFVPVLWASHVLWKHAHNLTLESTAAIESWTTLCTPELYNGLCMPAHRLILGPHLSEWGLGLAQQGQQVSRIPGRFVKDDANLRSLRQGTLVTVSTHSQPLLLVRLV